MTAAPLATHRRTAGIPIISAPPEGSADASSKPATTSPSWAAYWQHLAALTTTAAQDPSEGLAKFWAQLTQTVAMATGAQLCVLYALESGTGGASGLASEPPADPPHPTAADQTISPEQATEHDARWRVSGHWPAAPTVTADKLPPLLLSVPQPVLRQALDHGVGFGLASSGRWQVAVASLPGVTPAQPMILVAHLAAPVSQTAGQHSGQTLSPSAAQPTSPTPGQPALGTPPEPAIRAMLGTLRGLPLLIAAHRQSLAAEHDRQRLAMTLELLGRVCEAADFQAACLALADDLASQFDAHTVSLSWQAREGLRLRAISHAEALERRSEHTALLEEAQQEAISQASELIWPPQGAAVDDAPHIVRAHQAYAQLQQPGHLASIPLWGAATPSAPGGSDEHAGKASAAANPASTHGAAPGLGAITLERQHRGFSSTELWALRLIADMVTPTLALLEQRHQALPKRLWRETRRSLPKAIKPQSLSGQRLAAGLGAASLLAMLVPVPYAVDAGATVKADTMALVGAPFDGYIEASPVTLGSEVRAGDLLVTLATRELKLERANLLADLAQHQREAEKRRNANQLPEMQIAEAQAAQTQAKLQQTDYRIKQAQIRAPIDGIVVEGEPAKNLGGAVRRGETVVKVAALHPLHIEAAVPERDLNLISTGATARIKLIAMPDDTRSLQVHRVIPAAAVKDGHNSFPVRIDVGAMPEVSDQAARMDQGIPSSWRPGMSGVAKIDTGWQALGWVLSRRAVDAVRFWVWW